MIEIEKPTINCAELSSDGKYGKFVIEPLERGYGITLGNSLRRMLLSSLQGAAVTSIKIDGVQHEFSTIPGVKEDVTEIVLNMKGLLVRLHGNEAQYAHIDVEREGEVTAADIQANSSIEILNPEMHIATLGKDTRFSMDITIGMGRGYVPSERNKPESHTIGTIVMDSSHSPIKKVNYQVENTRVGNITDYDKLTLEVWTNGSMSAKTAVSLSAKILSEHLALFVELAEDVDVGEEMWHGTETDNKEEILSKSLDTLELSNRSLNALLRSKINTVEQLINLSSDDMLKIRNLGAKCLEEIVEKLDAHGLSLRVDKD